MNIHPTAASLSGTARAAARGGQADSAAAESTRQQSTADTPAGKAADSTALDAGDETGDRGGNGRQMLDPFERSGEQEDPGKPGDGSAMKQLPARPGSGKHLDLQA